MTSITEDSFETLVVLQFSPATPSLTKDWVFKKITGDRNEDDGADFLARFDPDPDTKGNVLLIGATMNRLLLGAEEFRIKKWHKEKGLQEFLMSDKENFENSENPADILLTSEKQRIIWEELQLLRPSDDEHTVPGQPTKLINQDENTILGILEDLNFLSAVFPLHEKEEIKLLERDWFKSKDALFKSQDIRKIRDYFGENIAFYFAFVEYYTKALIPPAILGLILTLLPGTEFFKYASYCIFNVLWWTLVMERWKRLTNRLASEWGTLDLQTFERPRAHYYGEMQISPITGLRERFYPPWKRMMKKYLVSVPVIIGCLIMSLIIYFTYYGIQQSTNEKYPLDGSIFFVTAKLMRLVPSISYSLLIIPINMIYKSIASSLNDFENHRLQSSHENNMTAKLFVFFFVNCFASLFYEAFFKVDYGNVAQLLTSMVVINALILKFTDQIAPVLIRLFKKDQLEKKTSNNTEKNPVLKEIKVLTAFEGTYGDYLTIFEQYGYVSLFSAVFPWVTICALINNIFEIRADAYKYCYVYRRSFSRAVSNIGSWHYAFDILSSVSIVTNTALIAMQPSVRAYFSNYNDVEYILMFVAAEHVLLALKFIIDFAIPDVPQSVKIARTRALYESNQALRRERQRRAKKLVQ